MNAGVGATPPKQKAIPTWAVVTLVISGVVLVAVALIFGFVMYKFIDQAVRYERVNEVMEENYRKVSNGEFIPESKPFSGSDAISTFGNELHEMTRLLQLEYMAYVDRMDELDFMVEEHFYAYSDQESYDKARASIDDMVIGLEEYVAACDKILSEFGKRVRDAVAGDRLGTQLADDYIRGEEHELDFFRQELEPTRDLAKARKQLLALVWVNRTHFEAGSDEEVTMASHIRAGVKSQYEAILKEIERHWGRLDEIEESRQR